MPPIYHFTHGSNLESILRSGELRCHRQAETVADVGDASIKMRRGAIRIRGWFLSDYVPFYFAPQSPMLYRLHMEGRAGIGDGQRPLIYFVSSSDQLIDARCDCVLSTRNAAAKNAIFHAVSSNSFEQLVDWQIMEAPSWTDVAGDPDRKGRRQAEFLVRGSVPLANVDYLAAIDDGVAARVADLVAEAGAEFEVIVRPDWYFT